MSAALEVFYAEGEMAELQKTYVKPLSQPVVAVASIVLGVGASLGFGLGGLYLIGDSWMSYNEITGTYYTMTTVSVLTVKIIKVSFK